MATRNDTPTQLSIVIPVLNEATTIGAALAALQPLREVGHEVIVADGGSQDGTREAAEGLHDQWVTAARGRAVQMNAGAAAAQGDVLVFLHADTRLPADAPDWLARFCRGSKAWGRFDVRLSGQRFLFRVIAFFMNHRSRMTGICTGDQALFVRRAVFEALGGFDELPLMEDVALSRRLRQHSWPFRVPSAVTTDSRRWQKHGAWRTIALMWRLRWAYWCGVAPERLARRYYGTD